MNLDLNLILTVDGKKILELPISEEAPPALNATETDIVELVLALHAAGVFPGLTQEALIERMRRFSGQTLQNWEQLGANIRRRGSLKFLDRLHNSLSERNEEILENGRANRHPKFPQK